MASRRRRGRIIGRQMAGVTHAVEARSNFWVARDQERCSIDYALREAPGTNQTGIDEVNRLSTCTEVSGLSTKTFSTLS